MSGKSDKIGMSSDSANRILATKKLSAGQKELLQNSGFNVVEYNAIKVNFLNVPVPPGFEKLIFTSKNGVRAFLELLGNKLSEAGKLRYECYCVGNKTAGLLKKNGFRVKVSKPGSLELARYIIAYNGSETYLYCCGNLRRKELPKLLREHSVKLKELVVYETVLNPVRVDGTFDAVLFFSPTGVLSFSQKNVLGGATAWCIGPTTASEVKKYTDRFNISPVPDTKTLITMMIKDLGPKAKQPK